MEGTLASEIASQPVMQNKSATHNV